MSRPSLQFRWLPLLFIFQMLCCSLADVGTASQYDPPYAPTACYGRDNNQFPASNLFGAAGEGIWDNGAACGRQYLVRCISAVVQGTCIPGETIQVRIVDRAQTAVSRPTKDGTTVVLSTQAYAAIADPAIAFVNIEFQQSAFNLTFGFSFVVRIVLLQFFTVRICSGATRLRRETIASVGPTNRWVHKSYCLPPPPCGATTDSN